MLIVDRFGAEAGPGRRAWTAWPAGLWVATFRWCRWPRWKGSRIRRDSAKSRNALSSPQQGLRLRQVPLLAPPLVVGHDVAGPKSGTMKRRPLQYRVHVWAVLCRATTQCTFWNARKISSWPPRPPTAAMALADAGTQPGSDQWSIFAAITESE